MNLKIWDEEGKVHDFNDFIPKFRGFYGWQTVHNLDLLQKLDNILAPSLPNGIMWEDIEYLFQDEWQLIFTSLGIKID